MAERRFVQAPGGPLLHDLTRVQHDHAVGDRAHEAKIVRDEDIGYAAPHLDLAKQLDDSHPHRNVEG